MGEGKRITIYCRNGTTFRFGDVTNLKGTVEFLQFKYLSAADQTQHEAVFRKNKIAGYSFGG